MKKFTECLNDLMDYFILGDPEVLSRFQKAQQLPNDLITEFTTRKSGDWVVEQGVMVPLAGIQNYPYAIYFNLDREASVFDSKVNKLQFHQKGYILQVQSKTVYLFTMPYLLDWAKGYKTLQENQIRPKIKLANGWYKVEILGGETKDENGWEPTFEFQLNICTEPPVYQGNSQFNFKIDSQEY